MHILGKTCVLKFKRQKVTERQDGSTVKAQNDAFWPLGYQKSMFTHLKSKIRFTNMHVDQVCSWKYINKFVPWVKSTLYWCIMLQSVQKSCLRGCRGMGEIFLVHCWKNVRKKVTFSPNCNHTWATRRISTATRALPMKIELYADFYMFWRSRNSDVQVMESGSVR